MKKLLILMLSFFLLVLVFAACSDITNIVTPQDVPSTKLLECDNRIVWTGQGMDALPEECSEEGYIHWVLNQAKDITNAVLYLEGSGSESYDEPTVTPGGVYHFYTPYFDLETLKAFICYEGELGNNAQFIISDYCPGEDSGVVLFEEDFTGETSLQIPSGWTATMFDVNSNWYVTYSNYAGGTSPEITFSEVHVFSGTSRLISPIIDASAASGLELSFKHMLDYYSAGTSSTLKVQASLDEINWIDTDWSVTPMYDIKDNTVTVDLSAYDGQTFYLAWVFEGYSHDLDYWYIDDINVYED